MVTPSHLIDDQQNVVTEIDSYHLVLLAIGTPLVNFTFSVKLDQINHHV